jgi:Flp pilus assembly protein TadD
MTAMRAAILVLALLAAARGVPAQTAPPAEGAGDAGPAAWLALTRGRSTYARGLYATASVELGRAAALLPSDPWPPFLAGRALLQLGRPAEAEVSFRAALKRAAATAPRRDFPEGVCRAELGRALQELGRHAEAETAYREALGQGAADPVIRVRLASVLADLGRFEQAREELDAAGREGAEGREGGRVGRRIEAAELRAEGREEDAVRIEEDLERQEAGRRELRDRGRAGAARVTERRRAGDLEGAREALRETLAIGPRDATLLAHLGGLAATLGLRGEARSAYEASLGFDPTNPGALHGLGLLEVEDGRPMEGLDLLRAAARRDPDDWKVHDDLAALYLRLGRGDDATRELRLALARNPFYLPGYEALESIHAAYGEARMASFYRGRRERVAAAAAAAARESGPAAPGTAPASPPSE